MNRKATKPRLAPEQLAGGLLVLALHAAALWALLSHRLITLPAQTPMLFVDLIAPPAPRLPQALPAAPRPVRQPLPEAVRSGPILSTVTTPAANEAPTPLAPPPAPAIAVAPAPTPAVPPGPLRLAGELAVSCPARSAPEYPLAARRRNETGTALLHVELDETGQVATASVLESSGSPRLDGAALAAVRNWRCHPPQRNGQAVRAIARQAFNFVLQGS